MKGRDDRKGTQIGQYVVHGELASGGMGTVYVATHGRLGHVVGIKVLHKHYQADTELRSRFVDEAKIQANLRHPNILGVQDIIEAEDHSGIVMELLNGCPLDAYYETAGLPIPLPRLLKLFSTLSGALFFAHTRGVVHRDLKPANVFLHRFHDDVVPKVMDFGIAKVRGLLSGSKQTTAGAVMGTPAYMAPEQLEDASTVDHRADVFSLGVMMYEAATGQLPFNADNMASLLKDILVAEPARPSQIHRTCPPQLDRVIMKCLEKDRSRRFDSALALQEELKRLGHEVGFEGIVSDDVPSRGLDDFGVDLPAFALPRDTHVGLRAASAPDNREAGPDGEALTVVAGYRKDDTGQFVGSDPSRVSAEPTEDEAQLPGLQLPGYRLLGRIYAGTETVVYRAVATGMGDRTVMVKVLNTEYPSPEAIARLKHEYALTKDLDIEGVARTIALEKFGNGLALVVEDFGGTSLKSRVEKGPLPVDEVLDIGSRLSGVLSQVHARQIVHRDINPRNIVMNHATGLVKFIDFGLASTTGEGNAESPGALAGTLSYISPEQTGRMNRPVDHRTDFYSLGATLYELATGRLPFQSDDRVELIHCHLARQPALPHETNPAVPTAFSDIIMKLMSKNAEDRYQSAQGLQADIEECIRQFRKTGRIQRFPLAAREVNDKFQIPRKLYGREAETDLLLEAFARVSHGTRELLLVAGYSGIGKTSLVREVHKPITQQRGYFISGKFDQYKRDVPYSALVDAFQGLVRELLTEGDSDLETWRNRIGQALGPNGAIITDIIPQLELVIGKQPPVPELGAAEARNRHNIVFSAFIGVFARAEHPLVVFLDDLQWADSASIEVLHLLVTGGEGGSLFLIGAFRDNEVDASHPLTAAIDDMRKAGAVMTNLKLQPLSVEHVQRLVADTVSTSLQEALPLAQLVHARTEGNPFFIGELLKSLHSQGHVSFDATAQRWRWDLEKIQAEGITENVVDLMAGKMRRMSHGTQQALQLAACIGGHFDLQTLATVSGRSAGEIVLALKEAVKEGLLVLPGEAYRFIELDSSELSGGLLDAVLLRSVNYRFAHDKIQQAAYSLVKPRIAVAVHHQIGTLLLKDTPAEKRESRIFEIVNQLNKAQDLLKGRDDRMDLAGLNLAAARRAKTSAAFRTALGYLETGIGLLDDQAFDSHRETALGLHCEAAEASYLCTRFDRMEQHISVVLAHARTLDEKMQAHEVQIQGYIAQAKKWEAVRTALPVLRMLGHSFKETPGMPGILWALAKAKLALAGKTPEKLLDHKQMIDARALAALRVATRVASTAYVVSPNLFPVLVLKQVELSARLGNSPGSSFAYALYGTILCGVLGDIETGYRFGKLALSLLDKYNSGQLKPRVCFTVAATSQHYKEHYDQTIPRFREAVKLSLEMGDPEFVGANAGALAYATLFSGKNLPQCEKDIGAHVDLVGQLKQAPYERYLRMCHQAVRNLRGRVAEPWVLKGESVDETAVKPVLEASADLHGLAVLYLLKCMLALYFDKPHLAAEFANAARPHVPATTAMLPSVVFHMVDALAALAVLPSATGSQKGVLLKRVRGQITALRKLAKHAPQNYLHRMHLAQAELHRVEGRTDAAIASYDRAIELAREHGFVQDEALAGELAARFYLASGKSKVARTYMSDAHQAHVAWGATAKAKQLERAFPELLADVLSVERVRNLTGTIMRSVSQSSESTSDSSSSSARDKVDMAVVMKASHAIASEKRLDLLLERVMKILVDAAGAQAAFLALDTDGVMYIEAEVDVQSDRTCVLQHTPVRDRTDIPSTAVNYVMRLRDLVVLDNALQSAEFSRDSHIMAGGVKSLLCLPLMSQGRLAGIVCLENRIAAGVFSPGRVEMVKMLAAQMVVSIENARLVARLDDSQKPG